VFAAIAILQTNVLVVLALNEYAALSLASIIVDATPKSVNTCAGVRAVTVLSALMRMNEMAFGLVSVARLFPTVVSPMLFCLPLKVDQSALLNAPRFVAFAVGRLNVCVLPALLIPKLVPAVPGKVLRAFS